MLFMFVCSPVHMYGHSDRSWAAIVVDFNVCWAALPTGGWHRLLAVCNCKAWEAWNKRQCTVRATLNHDEGGGGRTVTGVHGSVTGIQNKSVTGGMEKRGGTKV